jgi:anti-anti-sigma factor
MDISENRRDSHLVLSPAGRLDSINAPILERRINAVIEQGDIQLVIDMAALDYISSIGLSVLLAAAKKIKRADGRIVLAGMNERVGAVMEISGFNKIFVIFPTVEHAVVVSASEPGARALSGQSEMQ